MAVSTKKHGIVPEVRQSARQIWLAGVGALSLAEEEAGKVVRFAGMESGRLFKALVKKGSAYEAKNRRRLKSVLGRVDDTSYSAQAVKPVSPPSVRKRGGRTGHVPQGVASLSRRPSK
jgi:hypothetical protein